MRRQPSKIRNVGKTFYVKMSPRLDDHSGLHNTFTGLQRSGRALVTDDEAATGCGSVPQCSTLIRTLEHFDEVGF